MDNIKRESKLGKTELPKETETSFDWQAYAVDLYIDDLRHATKEGGKMFVEKMSNT